MKSFSKCALSITISLTFFYSQHALSEINYSGDTVFTGLTPPVQGADNWGASSFVGEVNVGSNTIGELTVDNGSSIVSYLVAVGSNGTTNLLGPGTKVTSTVIENNGNLLLKSSAEILTASTILKSGSYTELSGNSRLKVVNYLANNGMEEGAYLKITDGAQADFQTNDAFSIIGSLVEIDGSNSSLNVDGGILLDAGNSNEGRVNVWRNGHVQSGSSFTLTGNNGNLAVLNIGNLSDASASEGGVVTTDGMLLSNIYTQLNIAGTGSRLNITDNLTNNGLITLSAGGLVNASSLTNQAEGLFLAEDAGSALNIDSIENKGILQVANGATVRANSIDNTDRINITGNGTRIDVAGQLKSTDSVVVQNGGTFKADSILIEGNNTQMESRLYISGSGGYVDSNTIELASSATSRAVMEFMHSNGDLQFSPQIIGNGDVNVFSGVTTLGNHNNYSGITRIEGGALRAGGENVFSASSSYILNGGVLDLNGHSQHTGNITNGGVIKLAGTEAGTILTVNGDFTGNGGTVVFGTELGDGNAISDLLIVTGNTSGESFVRVNNLGGSGAETLNGIELINVQGRSQGTFTQQHRIVAGAYDYRLFKSGKNYYLSSSSDLPLIPPEEGEGGTLPGGGENEGGTQPGSGAGNEGKMVLRPEGGAYAANLANASSLFNTRMSDRAGTSYLNRQTGEREYTSLWLHTAGDHNRVHAGVGQLETQANSFVTMLGGDVATTDRARLGLMAGYGNSKSTSVSNLSGYRAKGQINGYSTGAYGTVYAEDENRGLWVDGTLQYSWFNNTVDGEDEAGESYKSKGLSASLSTGYVIPLGEGERTAFFLQPQARVGWSGLKADDHTESNGTLVQSSGQDNVSSSIGVKAFMKGHASVDDQTGRRFGLFTEANWIHNTREYAVRMDDVGVSQSGSRNIAEVRVGLDGALGGGFGVKGTIGQQVGDKGWSDTSAAVGINYTF